MRGRCSNDLGKFADLSRAGDFFYEHRLVFVYLFVQFPAVNQLLSTLLALFLRVFSIALHHLLLPLHLP